eukprot:TRINITY_DN13444_c0_g1_i1.p1 TRINITY_DN13444_c0_g1~~TRINITY_DN13444_c0_g1_i1.p1  ORF type:complete len:489 (+),score=46.52 TRINITY_DN13444_c0_g1_i1:97-1563(+)
MGSIQTFLSNPVKPVQELIILSLAVFVLFSLYRFRENIMLALTGDTHLHGDFLDLVQWFMRCGGCCNGQWTTYLTRCWCCPDRLKNKNLWRLAGQTVGIASTAVEIRDIVVGDLPFQGRGDFYVMVQCSRNPAQVTSLAEFADPKIVHFPEVMTLRLRYSPLEPQLHICVRELNVVGSQDLCSLQLSAISVIDWASESTKNRFQMRPIDSEFELPTSPWICIEFGVSTDARSVDDLNHTSGGYSDYFVRTVKGKEVDQVSMSKFKTHTKLMDENGDIVREPHENDLHEIRKSKMRLLCAIRCCFWWVVILLIVFGFCRYYLYTCFKQYRILTMATLNHATFPISLKDLNSLRKSCDEKIEGTGISEGIPCNPSADQIVAVCRNLTTKQPPPGAGKQLFHDLFGVSVSGVECQRGVAWTKQDVCVLRNMVHQYDTLSYVLIFFMVLSGCTIMCCANTCIRRIKKRLQIRRNESDARDGEGETRSLVAST